MDKKQLIDVLKKHGFSKKILGAFSKVKREDFVPKDLKEEAYENEPLPIGGGATISQPYTIAFMLDLLELNNINNLKNSKLDDKRLKRDKGILKRDNKIKILEIGSGSGYVLALMDEISKNSEIYGIDRISKLVEGSKKVLKDKKNIKIICGDGSKGLAKHAPYDRILISAAASEVPEHLFEQLSDGGILVCPVQNSIFQIKKQKGKIHKKEFHGFVFVPLISD